MTGKRANQHGDHRAQNRTDQVAGVRLREGVPGFDVLRTGVLLRRYLFVHLGFVRALAGWLIATPRYEDKYVFGYHLWDHARHGLAISNRLKDLRGGLAEPSIDPDLRRVVEELVHAHDTSEFVAGAYLEL